MMPSGRSSFNQNSDKFVGQMAGVVGLRGGHDQALIKQAYANSSTPGTRADNLLQMAASGGGQGSKSRAPRISCSVTPPSPSYFGNAVARGPSATKSSAR
jgi:hypothetical protein